MTTQASESVGLHRTRVAELIVSHPEGPRRGSGYRVTATAVLTSAHVVAQAESVRVRFAPDLPGEWTATATSWWADPDSELAVVSINPRPGEEPVSAALFGRIGNRAAVLAVQGVGFPLWKMRTSEGDAPGTGASRYRDAHHLVGSAAVLSNWREGTLEVVVPAAPAADAASHTSPWEGMSGTAVWVDDRIVGVVAMHHPGDGPARLAVARVDRALDHLDPTRRAALQELLPLPDSSTLLPDVVPAPTGEQTASAHRAQLGEIAPDQLFDRDAELAELTRFCAGGDTYAWWQAGPWAGKTALMSWFSLHPPAGVDVVSFFITSRFAGQSDSDAFTNATLEQLAALVGEPVQPMLEGQARRGHLLRLLQAAAGRCAAAGRRLLLVVDGLDEDTAASQSSIASLLPRRAPAEVRVLVASRPHPDLPSDVPGDHPLRSVAPRMLTPSAHARHLEVAAKNELTRLLRGSGQQRDVLGLITASGGGLTRRDLEELTRQPPYELDAILGGLLGRSIASRMSTHDAASDRHQRVYLFAHETLRQIAEEEFGFTLAGFRQRLHDWADAYRARAWPDETPVYLLRGYSRMLAAAGEIPRLFTFATDRVRLNRILKLTGGDGLAFVEIAAASRLIAQQPNPDLGMLLVLALTRDDLAERNRHLPNELPACWVALGRPERAIALAHGIGSTGALTRTATALAASGHRRQAKELLDAVDNNSLRFVRLAPGARLVPEGAIAVVAIGDLERAERLASEPIEPGYRAWMLGAVARALAEAGQHARASKVAAAAETAFWTNNAEVRPEPAVAVALVMVGEYERADRLVQQITDAEWRVRTLGDVMVALVAAGQHDRAAATAHAAEITARAIPELTDRDTALCTLAKAMTNAAWYEHAERLAGEIGDPDSRTRALLTIAHALANTSARNRAATLAESATAIVREITDLRRQAEALESVAYAMARAGAHTKAERLARNIPDPRCRTRALCMVAAALTKAGQLHQAATMIAAEGLTFAEIYHPGDQEQAVVEALAQAGLHDQAEQLANEINHPADRSRGLVSVAAALAEAGLRQRAAVTATTAETIARQISNHRGRERTISAVVKALAQAGDYDRAERLSRNIRSLQQGSVLTEVIRALVAAGHYDRAERLAREPPHWWIRLTYDARNLRVLSRALAQVGEYDRAEQLAREIPDTRTRNWALRDIGDETSYAGEYSRTERLAQEISDPTLRINLLHTLAQDFNARGQQTRAADVATSAETLVTTIDGTTANHTLATVAEMLAEVGEYDRAEQLARDISSSADRAHALAVIARGLAEVGNHDRAAALAADVETTVAQIDVLDREHQLASVLQILVEAGEFSRAERLAREQIDHDIPYPFQSVISAVAVSLAEVGEYDRAEQTTQAISDPANRAAALATLSTALYWTGEHRRANTVATIAHRTTRGIYDSVNRARVLHAVAKAFAETGELDRAKQATYEISNPDKRAEALVEVASVAASRRVEPEHTAQHLAPLEANAPQIRALLAEATMTSAWPMLLPVIGKVDLAALQRLGDAVLANTTEQQVKQSSY